MQRFTIVTRLRILFITSFFSASFGIHAQPLDVNYLHKIHGHYNASEGKYWSSFTNTITPVTGTTSFGWLLTGIVTKDTTTTWKSVTNLGAQALNGILTTTLKLGFQRNRPFVTHPELFTKHSQAGSNSLPSGHTSMAFALATSLSLAYPKWYVIVPAYIYAGAMGYSRMYLGVHYPSDVFCGAIVGAGSAIVAHYLFRNVGGWATRVAPSIVRRISR